MSLDMSVPPVFCETLDVDSPLNSDSIKMRTQGLKWPAMTSLSFIIPFLSSVLCTTQDSVTALGTFQRSLDVRECVLEIRDRSANGRISDDRLLDASQSGLLGAHRHDEIEARPLRVITSTDTKREVESSWRARRRPTTGTTNRRGVGWSSNERTCILIL